MRTVRFYIENGIVDRPEGIKRGAYYTERHVGQLLKIKKMQKAGFSLEAIKTKISDSSESPDLLQLLRQPGDVRVWSHIFIRDGIELLIEPRQSGVSQEDVRRICKVLLVELDKSRKEIGEDC